MSRATALVPVVVYLLPFVGLLLVLVRWNRAVLASDLAAVLWALAAVVAIALGAGSAWRGNAVRREAELLQCWLYNEPRQDGRPVAVAGRVRPLAEPLVSCGETCGAWASGHGVPRTLEAEAGEVEIYGLPGVGVEPMECLPQQGFEICVIGLWDAKMRAVRPSRAGLRLYPGSPDRVADGLALRMRGQLRRGAAWLVAGLLLVAWPVLYALLPAL